MSNALEPLAKALLEARQSDGTWPEPLDWLAKQVLRKGNTSFGDADWMPYDPIALHWPKGSLFGLARLWLADCWRTLPNIPGWLTLLVERLSALIDKAEDRWHESPEVDTLSLDALVEAVKAAQSKRVHHQEQAPDDQSVKCGKTK